MKYGKLWLFLEKWKWNLDFKLWTSYCNVHSKLNTINLKGHRLLLRIYTSPKPRTTLLVNQCRQDSVVLPADGETDLPISESRPPLGCAITEPVSTILRWNVSKKILNQIWHTRISNQANFGGVVFNWHPRPTIIMVLTWDLQSSRLNIDSQFLCSIASYL